MGWEFFSGGLVNEEIRERMEFWNRRFFADYALKFKNPCYNEAGARTNIRERLFHLKIDACRGIDIWLLKKPILL